jgi:putative addiction module killer protein
VTTRHITDAEDGDALGFKSTSIFDAWFNGFTDKTTTARFRNRLTQAKRHGNFGDHGSVGDGVHEMRFHFGPGWRIYYFQLGPALYCLLVGGKKDTQAEDVKLAKMLKDRVEAEYGGD